ncbi:MAG TPA: hypothetical protein VJ900_01855 [Patescibacteria group bacterium]|nr:hypothetical protein [Patescibacteria group bacterium]
MLDKFEQPVSNENREANFFRTKKIIKRWLNPDEGTKKLHSEFQKKNEEIINSSPESNLKQVLRISCKISQRVMEHPEELKDQLRDNA